MLTRNCFLLIRNVKRCLCFSGCLCKSYLSSSPTTRSIVPTQITRYWRELLETLEARNTVAGLFADDKQVEHTTEPTTEYEVTSVPFGEKKCD